MFILYVEDDTLDVELTTREMARLAPQHGLECVDTLRAAHQLLDQSPERFDLVLVNASLPDGTGADLLGYVSARGLPLAVVIITGQGDQEAAAALLKAGADDYIVKRQDYLRRLPAALEKALVHYQREPRRRERVLRVLYADASEEDFQAARSHLASFAPHIQIVQVRSAAELMARLSPGSLLPEWDGVVTAHALPDSNALLVLEDIHQNHHLQIPVLVVTGVGSEDIATQALRLGASDYLPKKPGYLAQLPGLIEHAVSQARLARERQAREESESRYRRLAESAPVLVFRLALQPARRFEYVSPVALPLTGYTPEEFYSDSDLLLKLAHPEDRLAMEKDLEGRGSNGKPLTLRWVCKNGQVIWIELRLAVAPKSEDYPLVLEGLAQDVTAQREVEAEMQRQLQRLASLSSVDQAISNSFDLNLVLVVLLDKVVSELKVDAAAVLLYNPVSQMLEQMAGTGFYTGLEDDLKMRVGEAYAGLAMYDRRLVQFPDPALPEPSRDTSRLIAEERFVAGLSSPLITKGEVKGVLQIYNRSPLAPEPSWLGFLEVLSSQAAIAIDNAERLKTLQARNQELTLDYEAILAGWVRALELHERAVRDAQMKTHNQRVTEMTLELAEALRIPPEELSAIKHGALLHDIGKLGIPDAILQKYGPLSEEEWRLVRQHPRIAYDLLAPVPSLARVIEIPYCHHERWDGSGYPRGLKGEAIPLSARIFAVADVWDALAQNQVYRKAWPREEALATIREGAGKQFDPEVVKAFLKHLA